MTTFTVSVTAAQAAAPTVARRLSPLPLLAVAPLVAVLWRRLPPISLSATLAVAAASVRQLRPLALLAGSAATAGYLLAVSLRFHEAVVAATLPQAQGTNTARAAVRVFSRLFWRLLSPLAQPGYRFLVTTQASVLHLLVSTTQSTLMTVSTNPANVVMYRGDTAPTLLFQLIEDGIALPLDLTNATMQLFVRRRGELVNVFAPALSLCTALPNPAFLRQAVTANASAQIVQVNDATRFTAGQPALIGGGTANAESVTVTAKTGTSITAICSLNHLYGDAADLVGSTTDPVVNAANGYTKYAWPAGGLATQALYDAQLVITLPDTSVQHSEPFLIDVRPGF